MVNYAYYSEVRMTHSTLNMQCKSCGGTLKLDKERNVIVCPYCGAEELILESDEKIKQQTKLLEWEREDKQKQEIEHKNYKNSKSGKVSLVFAIICGVLFAGSINQISGLPTALRTVTFFIQAALFLMSYLTRKEIIDLSGYIRLKTIKLPTLFMAAGFILFIAIAAFSTL